MSGRASLRRTARACLSLFRMRVAEHSQYRLATLSGVATSLVWGVVDVAVFTVFFLYADNAGGVSGLTLSQTVSYVWVQELLLFFRPYSIDRELLDKITHGDVSLDMCRPLDLYWHWFARCAAGMVAPTLLRGGVCFGLAFLLPGGFGARPPATLTALGLFILSALCAFLLCTAYQMLVSALRVNIDWGDGPMHLMCNVAELLAGGQLPLQLWPKFLQPLLLIQPFAGLGDIPARLYVGSMAPGDAGLGLGMQLIWTAAFIVLGRRVMARRLQTIVAQGG